MAVAVVWKRLRGRALGYGDDSGGAVESAFDGCRDRRLWRRGPEEDEEAEEEAEQDERSRTEAPKHVCSLRPHALGSSHDFTAAVRPEADRSMIARSIARGSAAVKGSSVVSESRWRIDFFFGALRGFLSSINCRPRINWLLPLLKRGRQRKKTTQGAVCVLYRPVTVRALG
jgi:hypothetical protein